MSVCRPGPIRLLVDLARGLCGLDDLLRHVGGRLLVADEFKREFASALRDLTHIGAEIVHFGHRRFGLDGLVARVCRRHAEHAAAALVHLAHDVAHVCIRYGHFKCADGLEQNRVRLRHAGLVGERRRHLERHFARINRVVGAVVQRGLEANDRVARERPLRDTVAQALFHGGEEALRHRAAHDALGKLEAVRIARGELDPNVAELAVAAGLFLVAALHGDRLADCLAVRHARATQRDVHAEFRFELRDDHVEVLLAHATDDHFLRLHVVDEADRRILLRKAHDALRDFILVALVFRDDGHAHLGRRVLDGVERDLARRRAERVARIYGGELRDRADVAGRDRLDVLLLFAAHHHGFADALDVAGAHVDELRLRRDFAGKHFHVGELADERVRDRLKDDGRRRRILVDRDLDRVAVHIDGELAALFGGARREPAQAVHKLLHAAHQHRVAAEYRRDRAALDALRNADDDLLRREFLAGEIFFKELVARFGDGLVNGCAQALEARAHVGHRHLNRLAARIVVRLVFEHVDVFIGLAVLKIRDDDRAHGGAEAGLQVLENAVEIGALVAQAVDEEDLREPALLRGGKGLFRADGNAALAREHNDDGFRRARRLIQAALKIKEAGGVQQVDFFVFPLKRCDGRGNRRSAADLLGVVITDGVALAHLTAAVRCACKIEHCLCEGGLAGAGMARHCYVDDVLCLIRVHGNTPYMYIAQFRMRLHF